jgi:hypothetical protein
MPQLRSDDRVLSLGILSVAETAAMARVLISGVLVGIGEPDEVNEARQQLSEFDNVMFISAGPDRIPWRDAYFTKILIPPHLQAVKAAYETEWQRLLAPGGELMSATSDA